MIVDLPNTTTSKISKTLVKIREEGGAVALGRVLTLIISTRLGEEEEAIEAANDASREHPMRVIVVSSDPNETSDARVDAQIRVGGDAGASEVIVVRAYGDAAHDEESLVTGLLLPDAPVVKGLAEFDGVGRRFQRYGEHASADGGTFTLIDDYGHHPVEMAATLAAARGAFPGRRLVLAFQPHRYTRTRDCFEDFVKVIGQADLVLLAEVYAAGEAPIVAADGRALVRALRIAGKVDPVFVDEIEAMPQTLVEQVRDGDVVISMGAGSIGNVPAAVVALISGGVV